MFGCNVWYVRITVWPFSVQQWIHSFRLMVFFFVCTNLNKNKSEHDFPINFFHIHFGQSWQSPQSIYTSICMGFFFSFFCLLSRLPYSNASKIKLNKVDIILSVIRWQMNFCKYYALLSLVSWFALLFLLLFWQPHRTGKKKRDIILVLFSVLGNTLRCRILIKFSCLNPLTQ